MRKENFGFAMPAVIIITTALLGVSVILLQSVSSARSTVLSNYYLKLADEAAEAGTAYATACLEKNFHVQTWGNSDTPLNKLTQNSDCTGNQAAYPSSSVVASDNTIQSRFVVGDLEYGTDSSVQILATGYADIKFGSGGGIRKTYTAVVKKTITWNTVLNIEKSVSGTTRTCGVLSGSVYCWGTNAYGQLGNGTSGNTSNVPVKVRREASGMANKPVSDLAAGSYFNCAIAEGEVYCWGRNNKGQLGNGSVTDSSVPVKVSFPGGLLATKIGTSSSTACAILTNGDLYCWGYSPNGELGIGISGGGSAYRDTPQKVTAPSGATGATALSSSGAFANHLCAIYAFSGASKVFCWGHNLNGQLGDGTTTQRTTPREVTSTSGMASQVPMSVTLDGDSSDTAHRAHTCALTQASKVFCWGDDSDGSVGNGNGNNGNLLVPTEINYTNLGGSTVTEVAAGATHSCLVAGGRVYCWGKNSSKVLGAGESQGAGLVRDKPTIVEELSGALLGKTAYNIAAGAFRACVSADNRVFCWGAGGNGQIGDGNNLTRGTPTESIFLRPRNNQYIY